MATIQGIDVSVHQGDVDFDRVKRDGMEFVIVKCTEGEDFVDQRFGRTRVNAIRRAGLKVGVYHYLRPRAGRTGAVEVRHALRTARAAGWGRDGDIRLAIDIEETALSMVQTRTYLRQAVDEYKRQMGHPPLVYSFVSFLQELRLPETMECPLWLAHFDVSVPTIPKPWTVHTIWQKTSKASVGGESPVDLNVADNDRFRRRALVPKTKPDPEPTPSGSVNVEELQRSLNRFTKRWADGVVGPIRVDGDKGPATDKRILEVKYWLGYGKTDAKVTSKFVRRMRHPRDPRFSPPGMIVRGIARRRKAKQVAQAGLPVGVTRFDGVPCARWMIPYLEFARSQGWQGNLVSGWRDPVHSERLCLAMCGAPSCPDKCAGRSSNHVGSRKPKGAVDVSHYIEFGRLMVRCPLEPKLKNALGPRDPVHFSESGH